MSKYKVLKNAERPYFVHTQISVAEQGRSLTEMLGVLAVMGIISVVGVKMFHSAMDRHQANELIYEAQKRATSVAAQIMGGKEKSDLSVAEFPDPEGHTFGVEQNPANPEQFNITITGVKTEVCQKMKTAVGDRTPIRVISEFCDKLTFNNDLSTTVYASDIQNATECANAGNTWCGGTGVCQEESNCCAGKTVGLCQTCNEGAIISGAMEGTSCDYDENGTSGDGVCHLGQCQALPTNVTCNASTGLCQCTNGGTLCNRATGLCCATDQICNSAGDVNTTNTTYQAKCLTLSAEGSECTTNAQCTDPAKPWCKITRPSGVTSNCRDPSAFTGTCTSITTTANGGATAILASIYGLGNVIVSSGSMNGWSAENWCKANGKKLINIEAFEAYYYEYNVNYLVTTGSGKSKAACKQGKTCTYWNSANAAYAMWKNNGRVLTDAKDENGELYSAKYSPVVLDLAQQFKGSKNYFWTASDYSKVDTCNAFNVDVASGNVSSGSRDGSRFALCQ